MRSNNREYLPAVDHLRFAAAGLVVLYHAVYYMSQSQLEPGSHPSTNNPLVTFVLEGHTGVALFMVLSGFILTTGSLGREIDYRSFVRNRLLRVGPLYLVVLVVAMVVSGQRFSLMGAVQTSLGFATFSGGFTGGAFDRVLWTIGVELQFYMLFPFFLRLLTNRGARPLVQFIVLMAALRIVAALATPGLDLKQLTYYSIVGRIDQFLIGMLAAYAFPHLRRFVGRMWVAAIATALVVGGLWAFHRLNGWYEPHIWRTVWVDAEGLLWAFLLVSYVGTARFARGRIATALSWAGERSYGMYLLHMAVITVLLVRGWTLDVPGGVVVDAVVTGLVIVMPCTVALAALGFASVERPFLSLRRRYVVATPETAPPVAATPVAVAAEPVRPRAELPSPRPDLPSHPNHRADSTDHTVRFTLTEERVGV